MSASTLRASNLRKSFRGRCVVEGLSLEVRSGEIVGLLGPNGAGKTTAFYMIVGLVSADTGTVELDGRDLTSLPMHRRAQLGVGYLPQEASVFRRLTVAREHPEHPGDSRRPRCRGARLAAGGDHGGPAHRRMCGRTAAWRFRAANAAAWKSRGRWPPHRDSFCWTSPLPGVDPMSVVDIQRIIRELSERGIGVLITDHNVRETLGVCNRACIVDHGTVIASGSAEEILANERVREVYLGQNFRM